MKKLILMLAISAFAVSTDAQVNFNRTASNPTGAITNTSIDTATYVLSRGYNRVLFSMTYTRATGTGAGTAILEYKIGSADNYVSDTGDTITVTNSASKTYYWNKTVTAKYWRIRVGGGTTVTATVADKLSTGN